MFVTITLLVANALGAYTTFPMVIGAVVVDVLAILQVGDIVKVWSDDK